MAGTTKVALRRPRFKLHDVSEICRMSRTEWEDECRRDGADLEESPEDEVVREIPLGRCDGSALRARVCESQVRETVGKEGRPGAPPGEGESGAMT
jgi:hypothetical protein